MSDASHPPEILRILIVDDSPEDRHAYLRYLKRSRFREYSFHEVDTINSAIEACAAAPPACILLDYNLPDGDGIEFMAQLNNAPGTIPPPVVMLTGQGDEEVAVQAMKQGAFDYIVKENVNAKALCRAVHKAIEKSSLLRTIQRQQEEKDRLITELQDALEQVKALQGIIPICANCKQVRDDSGFWQQVEAYVSKHSDAKFSHSICPTCLPILYPTLANRKSPPPITPPASSPQWLASASNETISPPSISMFT